ncbi:hypothetical protein GCM10009665_73950 [Kitasatospora nipponensis]|uniref:Lipoprotein LprG n=1 Tax=Kitasatospora nipponensis TaxID=258049 RepID=A0ABN1T7M6_9ACTN
MRLTTPLRVAVTCAVLALGATACGSGKDAAKPAAAPAPVSASASAPTSASSAPSAAASAPAASAPAAAAGPDLSKLTGDQVMKQMVDTMKMVNALKIDMSADGPDTGTVAIKLAVDTRGQCSGTASFTERGSAEIVRSGDTMWIKPDAAFLKSLGGPHGAAASQQFVGHWLSGPKSDDVFSGLSDFCDLNQMTAAMAEDGDKYTKGATTTLNGRPALQLHVVSTDGSSSDLWIAAQGRPVVLQSVSSDQSKVTFSDIDVPLTVQLPDPANVVTTEKFKAVISA